MAAGEPARGKRRRTLALAVSLAAHAWLPFALVAAQGEKPAPIPPEPLVEPIWVQVAPPPPPPAPNDAPAGPPPPTPEPVPTPLKAPPVRTARPAPIPPPPEVPPLYAQPAPKPEPLATLSDAQLAGARTAAGPGGGEGAGAGAGGQGSGAGGGCDMVRFLQARLRDDPDIQAAARAAHASPGVAGRALLVWDGDWIQSGGQAGKGLAGVRQAIALEVAFAPEPCRREAMRGLVVISMGDGPGAPRLALGAPAWRWSDLLAARRG